MSCAADPRIGVAVRLADYLDCSARTLGEQGFQAVSGQALDTGLLSGLVTIFVALIGYRLLLGHLPSLRDGVTWALRLGIVLTLVTSWPAFQILAYRAIVDSPVEIAGVMLPSAGIPLEQLDDRVQAAYDDMRLGSGGLSAPTGESNATSTGSFAPSGSAPVATVAVQPPLPQTASLFVVTTSGVIGAMRLAAGFLLAVAPLAFLGLLFDATLGLVGGWIRAVAGSALGVLAATTVTSLEMVVVESEIGGRSLYGASGGAGSSDPQALTVIVLLFAVVMLAAVIAGHRMIGALRLPRLNGTADRFGVWEARSSSAPMLTGELVSAVTVSRSTQPAHPFQSRAAGVAEALSTSITRERLTTAGASEASPPTARSRGAFSANQDGAGPYQPSSSTSRRTMRRRTLSAARRDRAG